MPLFSALLILNLADIVTGFIKAVDEKNVASHVMKKGIITKVLQWIIIVVAFEIKHVLPLDIDIVQYVVYYYFVMEGISILENVSEYLPIPSKLKNVLESQKEE